MLSSDPSSHHKRTALTNKWKWENGKRQPIFPQQGAPYKGPAENESTTVASSGVWLCVSDPPPKEAEQHICVSPVVFFLFSKGSIGDCGGRGAPQMSIRAERKKDENRGKKKRKRGGTNGRTCPVSQSPHHKTNPGVLSLARQSSHHHRVP